MAGEDERQGGEAAPQLGAWARSGELVGLVARVDGSDVSLFDPAHRRSAVVPVGDVEPVPAGAVTLTATVDLPLAHGLEEADVRRWLATLLDDSLRERALGALAEAGLDEGAALPRVRLDVQAMARGGAVCLCGARVPAAEGTVVTCPACGREAVTAPRSGRP